MLSRSANCSTGTSPVPTSRASASTTCATPSLLVAAGTPIKVVSERLGHAHPGFTMATYQHLVPGMSATAAIDFANLITAHRDEHLDRAGACR